MASQPAARHHRMPRQRRRELVLDTAIAVIVFALSLALLAARGADSDVDSRSLDALGVALAALASLPLVARRHAPLAVFVLTAAASAALNALDYPPGPPLGPTVALFFLALSPERTRAPRWLVGVVVAAMLVIHAGAVGVADHEFPTVPLLLGALVWGGGWVVGDRVRQRRGRIAELEDRARRAEREAERERRLAAAEERTRIARDLHDSAGHAINVILVQAGAARLLGTQDPERAQAALETIEEVARETLGEIDQLVRVLREDGRPDDVDRDSVEPPLGLAALETLAERHRSAGLVVDVHTRGSRRALPPGVDQAAYRILQEALTNAARHGEGSANVDIGFGTSVLELVVWNPARGETPMLIPVTGSSACASGRPCSEAAWRWRRATEASGSERACPTARTPHEPRPVRVLLVDDDDLMRAGLKAVLSSDESIQVIGEGGDGRAAVSAARALKPDVVLMDVRMPDLDGISATREVLEASPEVKVAILTTFEQDDYIFGALSAGASGFLLKRTRPEDLIAGIHTIAAGDALLSPAVTRRVIERMAAEALPDSEASARLDELTPREREVLALIARGLSNGEIAATFVIETSTVKSHVRRIMMKLHLRDRAQAVIFAYESGLTRPGPPRAT